MIAATVSTVVTTLEPSVGRLGFRYWASLVFLMRLMASPIQAAYRRFSLLFLIADAHVPSRHSASLDAYFSTSLSDSIYLIGVFCPLAQLPHEFTPQVAWQHIMITIFIFTHFSAYVAVLASSASIGRFLYFARPAYR